MDIAAWLRELGLERYEEAFQDNEVDARSLPHLTAEDLKEMGVMAIGHRRLLLQAIAALQERAAAPLEPVPRQINVSAGVGDSAGWASEAERRPMTVMFCDLADSTVLSTELDPEDLQDLIRAYQERCTNIIRAYEGFVAKYMGDGILVYFGYPKSLERNAERAVRSGLAIVEAMAELNAELERTKGVEIAVRIGIATGLVVVGEIIGEGLAQERTVIGEAPNMAARLQSVAPRNSIVIGGLTKEIVGDAFVYEDLGAQELKGVTGLVKVWAVLGLPPTWRRRTARRRRLQPWAGCPWSAATRKLGCYAAPGSRPRRRGVAESCWWWASLASARARWSRRCGSRSVRRVWRGSPFAAPRTTAAAPSTR